MQSYIVCVYNIYIYIIIYLYSIYVLYIYTAKICKDLQRIEMDWWLQACSLETFDSVWLGIWLDTASKVQFHDIPMVVRWAWRRFHSSLPFWFDSSGRSRVSPDLGQDIPTAVALDLSHTAENSKAIWSLLVATSSTTYIQLLYLLFFCLSFCLIWFTVILIDLFYPNPRAVELPATLLSCPYGRLGTEGLGAASRGALVHWCSLTTRRNPFSYHIPDFDSENPNTNDIQ